MTEDASEMSGAGEEPRADEGGAEKSGAERTARRLLLKEAHEGLESEAAGDDGGDHGDLRRLCMAVDQGALEDALERLE